MRRKKRQNKITEKRNIQKEICRIPLLFLVLLSVMCTGSLTGCRVGNPQGQTELVPLNRNDTDSDKPDTAVNSGQKEQQTDREKLQICYVHVCGAVNQPGVYELTADSRLFEAIQMAGGLTEEAADQTLNQAEVIEDGSILPISPTSCSPRSPLSLPPSTSSRRWHHSMRKTIS